jgi:hypothetical protein
VFSLPNNGERGKDGSRARSPEKSGMEDKTQAEQDDTANVILLQSKIVALELEPAAREDGAVSEAGSQAGSQSGNLAAGANGSLQTAIEAQTTALMTLLTKRTGRSTVSNVRAEVHWMNLTDDQGDSKSVKEFYDSFEDNCAMANDCDGMNHREMFIALRAWCRGTRLKSYQNIYQQEWRAGTILADAEKVYTLTKEKHLMFAETEAEKEIRVDNEFAILTKGENSGHQFEPLFECAITELEAVGLGKSRRSST